MDHPSPCDDTVHADLVELECTDDLDERIVLGFIHELGSIDEAFRQGWRAAK